jgi:hypothetical protein
MQRFVVVQENMKVNYNEFVEYCNEYLYLIAKDSFSNQDIIVIPYGKEAKKQSERYILDYALYIDDRHCANKDCVSIADIIIFFWNGKSKATKDMIRKAFALNLNYCIITSE